MNITEQQIATSVLVIGTGGAGLRAAIELAEQGVEVLALGKRPRNDAHTSLAAGGINAALATMDPEDTWQQHAADTLQESYLLANPDTVRIVAEGAAQGIADLERYGMPFAREADGRISQRFFGAHTYRRTAFAGDYTGLEIQRTLINRAVQLGVPIRDPELVQFHPSGLIEPENAAGTLVSEAARGEGGQLRNALGERFMTRYDAERMELSTRDRVALAEYTEIKE